MCDCGNKTHNGGLLRYSLIPDDALEEVVRVLMAGAEKHGDFDWEKGVPYTIMADHLQSHFWDWFRGADIDPDDGLSNMAHVACRALFLLAYELRGIRYPDDRHVHELAECESYGDPPGDARKTTIGIEDVYPGGGCAPPQIVRSSCYMKDHPLAIQ